MHCIRLALVDDNATDSALLQTHKERYEQGKSNTRRLYVCRGGTRGVQGNMTPQPAMGAMCTNTIPFADLPEFTLERMSVMDEYEVESVLRHYDGKKPFGKWIT